MKNAVVAASVLAALVASANPKYVFLFIGDGMSTPQRMVADEFARETGHGQLSMNLLPNQATTRTRSANSLVTDSAAAGTAIACGTKTNNGMLGVDPATNRLESVAEVAKKAGKKVGIVTSVTICHATPGGFYAHRRHRSLSYQIGQDLIASGFDYFAGGGLGKKGNDKKDPFYQGDIYELAAKAGYNVVRGKAGFDMLKAGGGKAWAVISEDAIPFAIDGYADSPTLAEITAKGIELLQDGKRGFFMMVEGGKLDWAGHANDAATNLREAIALDDAVRVAIDFMKKHPNETLIVTTGDHETGGMAMGFAGTGYAIYPQVFAKQTCSASAFDGDIRNAIKADTNMTFAVAQEYLTAAFGFVFDRAESKDLMRLTDAEIKELKAAFENDRAMVIAKKQERKEYDAKKKYKLGTTAKRIISNHAGIGWSSGAHTALPVLTTADGVGSEQFRGFIENVEIARRLKELVK